MLLEVGDRIYFNNGSHFVARYTITRVTKTKAFFQVNKDSESSIGRDVGDGKFISDKARWSRCFYSVESDKVIADFVHTMMLQKIDKIKFADLSNEALKKIVEIANGEKKND